MPVSLTAAEYIRSILGIIVFFLMLLLFTPFIFLLLIISLGRLSSFVVESIAPLIVKPVFWTAGIRFRIEKRTDPIPCPAVFIINHSSSLDILTILALGLPRVRFVAKWQLQYNPIFFLLGHLTGQVFIRREKSEKAVATLKKNVSRLKRKNLSVMLAPEGSRKHPGIIGPFKKGPFRMAMDLGYPIVPVYFDGNRELSSGGFLFTKSGSVTATIHPPVSTDDWTLENIDQHIADIRQRYLEWAGISSEEENLQMSTQT
ncbi:1-acyl-sn-glycerol-3-phosphate acyltransferase [Rhodohalobacter mucosus]|uniref:1-acyl-sn-glycerol-3-phosphate acyltransferase n=1 Tax=Rhodohalobacter mucosus TaxID=2079485 RepID=A0A316TYT1_9BACT|nr:1-acyl-sn-glycerol-3-phosphate acyltransferase [Rhodohalobacter mucosus]